MIQNTITNLRNKMTEKMIISVCGLICTECRIYQASQGNKELAEEISTWFRNEMNVHIQPDQINCEGCKESAVAHWSPNCKIMLCARSKKINHCFQCEEYPCEKITEFGRDGISSHMTAIENLERMKEIGIEKWIIEHINEIEETLNNLERNKFSIPERIKTINLSYGRKVDIEFSKRIPKKENHN
jgi:hypothetical protein